MLNSGFVSIKAKRMTWLTAAISIVAVVFALGTVSASAQPKNLDPGLEPVDTYKNGTYYNKDFGFRVSIPKSGWKGYPDPELPNVIFVAMRQSKKNEQNWVDGQDFHPNVTLGVEILPAGIGTREYAVAATRALELAGWSLLEERVVKWGGQEGYEIRAKRESDNVALLQRFTVLNGGAVVLASTARPKQMKTVEKDFRTIFNSFKVVRKKKKRKKRSR